MKRLLVLSGVLFLLLPGAAAAPAAERWFAVVVGVNRPLQAHEKPLRFADNDALKYYEFFRQFIPRDVDAAIFTELDDDSRTYPAHLQRRVRAPRKGAILASLRGLNERILAVRRAHPTTTTRLFFAFSGHGGEDEAGGYLNVLSDDGGRVVKLTKLELWRDVLGTSVAHRNHVIIDACSSGSFVTAKDNTGRKRRFTKAWRRFLRRVERERAVLSAAFERTTFFVSSDALVKSHEYGEFQGGVFTHELLSALRGAADIDTDGRVTYGEIRAFLTSANARAKAKEVFGLSLQARLVVPSALANGAFIDYAKLAKVARLQVDRGVAGRFFLVDERNHRYADFHKTNEYPLHVALVPRPKYFLYREEVAGRREIPIDTPAPGERAIVASIDVDARVLSHGERGPLEEALARLFETPLQAASVQASQRVRFAAPHAYLAEHLQVLKNLDATRRAARYVLYGVGGAAAALATYFGASAAVYHARTADPQASQVDASRWLDARNRSLLGMGIGLGAAAAALLSGVFLFGEERDGPSSRTGLRAIIVGGSAGGGLGLGGRF